MLYDAEMPVSTIAEFHLLMIPKKSWHNLVELIHLNEDLHKLNLLKFLNRMKAAESICPRLVCPTCIMIR